MFKSEITGCDHDQNNAQEQTSLSDDMAEFEEASEEVSENEIHDLGKQLEHNLASLLFKMQTVMHIPESSVQEILQQLCHINKLTEPLLHSKMRATLNEYFDNVDDAVVSDITSAVSECNMISFCAEDRPLGTTKKRIAYVRKEFPLVNPIEYVVEKGKKPLAYVPIVPMLQKLLNKTDVIDKALPEIVHVPKEYTSYADGHYFNKNSLLAGDEFTIALGLYIDKFEVVNPLGTSKLKNKCVQCIG